ncbi:MAG: hypothetical protein ACRESJ_13020 [Pseudomonas sp.]|uniref:hypothetical protein n=1 Tax=Pseudomonas sp. TaxID=306 RepID=UPI003D6F9480
MTIDIKVVSTPDISVANDIINPHRAGEDFRSVMSAASFLVAGASSTSMAGVLSFVYSLIDEKLPGYDIWLFLGNSAWQPDTRIIRYRELWGGLKFRGSEISGSSNSQVSVVEAHGKLKFFGALRISKLSISNVVEVIVDERCSYIVATPKALEIKRILEVGWSGNMVEDFGFCCCICEKSGLLFKQVGEFDDDEWGFVSVGSPKIMEKLLSKWC